ncbi:MAG: hypothetical protein RLZZ86_3925, partial [Cyanobacteriota bacterium]
MLRKMCINREQGNFTFRYLCRFFSVHLLSPNSSLDVTQNVYQ